MVCFLGQKILLGLSSEEELSVDLNIQTEIVSFTDLGGVKPTVEAQDCVAVVQVKILLDQIKIA